MDDRAKCEAAFSKRKSNLLKKANEIAAFCDVDIAIVAFSPSGRVSKFCNRDRIEDVLERYVKLTPDKRYQNVRGLEWKLQKLKLLDYIKEDDDKLHHLDNQIKNVEFQIKKTATELEILQANLKDFELENEEDASLTQVLWCEKNLKKALQEIKVGQKNMIHETYLSLDGTVLKRQGQTSSAGNHTGNKRNKSRQNQQASTVSNCQYLMQSSMAVQNGLVEAEQQQQSIGISSVGSSSSFAINPLAATSMYQSRTQQTNIPPAYPPIQSQLQPFSWDPTAASFRHLLFRNSSTHQAIGQSPAAPFVPYQPVGAFGTCDLMGAAGSSSWMLGNMDQQLGEIGSSSSAMPDNVNRQLGVLGSSFADQSLMIDDRAPYYVQFQQPCTEDLGLCIQSVNDSNMQNDATQLFMSQIQVDPNEVNLLCIPNFDITQSLDATPPPLNSQQVPSQPFIANDIGTIINSGGVDNINNNDIAGNITSNNGSCNTNETLPTEQNSHPASPTDSAFLDNLFDEAAIERDTKAAGNKELDWDGFVLNLDDLDNIF